MSYRIDLHRLWFSFLWLKIKMTEAKLTRIFDGVVGINHDWTLHRVVQAWLLQWLWIINTPKEVARLFTVTWIWKICLRGGCVRNQLCISCVHWWVKSRFIELYLVNSFQEKYELDLRYLDSRSLRQLFEFLFLLFHFFLSRFPHQSFFLRFDLSLLKSIKVIDALILDGILDFLGLRLFWIVRLALSTTSSALLQVFVCLYIWYMRMISYTCFLMPPWIGHHI